MEKLIKRKRGEPAKVEAHPSFESTLERMLIKGCSNRQICDRLNGLVKKLRSEGKIDHLPEDFEFSLSNVGHAAKRITKEFNERAARKQAERAATRAYSQAVSDGTVEIDSLLLSGQLLEDMITRVVIEMDDSATNELDLDRLDRATLSYKRLTESKRVMSNLFENARKKMAEQLLEAAKQEASVVNNNVANPVEFVQRLIEQANAVNKKQA
jgi:outer membrane murein-binding lipoprotein Lpp